MPVGFVLLDKLDPSNPSWKCSVDFAGGGSLLLWAEHLSATPGEFTSHALVEGAQVSIGGGVDGVVRRQWPTVPSRIGEPNLVNGYLWFPCTEGTPGLDRVFLKDMTSSMAGGRQEEEPGYRHLATAFVLVANAVRAELGCEGEPFPLPEGLTDDPPAEVLLGEDDPACDTFGAAELGDVLPEPGEFARWHAWHSPGDDFPVTSCEIWRHPVSMEERSPSWDKKYTFGPMLSFTRVAGYGGEHLDLDWVRERFDLDDAWGGELGSEGYAGERDGEYNVVLRRDCDGDTVTYLGRATPTRQSATTSRRCSPGGCAPNPAATGVRYVSSWMGEEQRMSPVPREV